MNFNGATQQLDFSQNTILDAIIPEISGQAMGAERANDIRGGICYMLSMEWIRKIYKTPLASSRTLFPEDVGTKAGQAYYTQIANNFCKYCDDVRASRAYLNGFPWLARYPSTSYIALNNLDDLHTNYVQLCIDSHLKAVRTTHLTTAAAAEAYIRPLLATPNTKLFVGLSVPLLNGGVAGHRVAMRSDVVENTFFDPNFGVYQITNLLAFLQDFWNRYGLITLSVTEIV